MPRSTISSGSARRPTATPLRALGHSVTRPPTRPAASILDTFPNRTPGREYLIEFTTSDFSSLCPVTGQPDFARLHIAYVPAGLCLETKALKLYLAAFRHTRSFNEEIINRILNDLVAACQPRRMLVKGEFSARGGIAVTVSALHPAATVALPGLAQTSDKTPDPRSARLPT